MSTNIRIQKLCEYCGNPFTAKTLVTRYCSKPCNVRHYKQLARDRRVEVHVSQTVNATPLISSISNDYFEIAEAANIMRISKRTLYRLIALQKIKKKKVMTRTVILKKDIKMFFDQQ